MLGGEEGAGEVDVERLLPDRAVQAVGAVVGADELDRRVGDDDVEPVPARRCLLDRVAHRVLVAHVGVQCERVAPQRRGRLAQASASTSTSATRAPSRARRSAIARPIPRAAPVTIARLPSRPLIAGQP